MFGRRRIGREPRVSERLLGRESPGGIGVQQGANESLCCVCGRWGVRHGVTRRLQWRGGNDVPSSDTLFQYRSWKVILASVVCRKSSFRSSERNGEYPQRST